MKIAILYFEDIKNSQGGDDAYFLNLSRNLIEKGHEVSHLGLFSIPSKINLWVESFFDEVIDGR